MKTKRRSCRSIATWPAVVLLLACLFTPALADSDAKGRQTWGEDTLVAQVGRFFIAGQPDLKALELARDNDVSMVINLRLAGEFQWDEEGAAAKLGLEYHQVPVKGARPQLDAAALERVTALVQAKPEARIMVHCASGNRAAAWLAVYLHGEQGMSADEAIAVANSAGLSKQGLERKVRTYLEHVES